MNKVLQAAGRVIRTQEDKGVVLLLDDRFAQSEYARLFPKHWRHLEYLRDTKELKKKISGILGNNLSVSILAFRRSPLPGCGSSVCCAPLHPAGRRNHLPVSAVAAVVAAPKGRAFYMEKEADSHLPLFSHALIALLSPSFSA